MKKEKSKYIFFLFREFNSFFDDQLYLNQDNFRNWMEGILDKVARATSGNDIIKLPGYAPVSKILTLTSLYTYLVTYSLIFVIIDSLARIYQLRINQNQLASIYINCKLLILYAFIK